MPRYIALLRGINVGGHNVKMDRLRALFEELGFRDVATFIASGNVIFTAPDADERALTGADRGVSGKGAGLRNAGSDPHGG